MFRTGSGCDVSAEIFGQLNGNNPNTTRTAGNENLLSRLDVHYIV